MANQSGTDHSNEKSTERHNLPSAPSENPPRSYTDEQNPFIAFRRYADEQISSILQSLMGLPSMMEPPLTNKWSYFDERDQQCLRKGEENGERDSDNQSNEQGNGRRWGYSFDRDYSGTWTFPRRPLDLFDTILDGFGGSLFSPESMFFGEESQTWPIPYLLFSPYSPLHIERSQGQGRHHRGLLSSLFQPRDDAELHPSEPRWRDAFEDLLRVENGQPMLDRSTESDRLRQTGNEWLRGLVQRGSIGNNWKLVGPEDSHHGVTLEKSQQFNNKIGRSQGERNSADSHGNNTDKSEAETELDLYDRFLDDIVSAHERYSRAFADSPLMRLLEEERKHHLEREETSRRSGAEQTQSKDWLEYSARGNKQMLDSQSEDEQLPSESRVVSTMTRTVRRTLPDGSISTKTIKTKRYHDGREESDESVEVIPPPSIQSGPQSSSSSDQNDAQPKGGWFWSR